MGKYEGPKDAVDDNQGSKANMREEMGAENFYTILSLQIID